MRADGPDGAAVIRSEMVCDRCAAACGWETEWPELGPAGLPALRVQDAVMIVPTYVGLGGGLVLCKACYDAFRVFMRAPGAETPARPLPRGEETERLLGLLRGVAVCGIEARAEPPGLAYHTVQVDAELWDEVGAAVRRHDAAGAP